MITYDNMLIYLIASRGTEVMCCAAGGIATKREQPTSPMIELAGCSDMLL
jgi:hypothetical protein